MSKKGLLIPKPGVDEYPAYAAMYIKWLPDDRALRFGRGDTTDLPGFEQEDYVPYSRANER